jgi:flagellar hook protein FlgE
MSLYGALYSGVAGLAAQSNKIGIISDNIANVNTVGYKGTRGNFETLVTSSSSAGSSYSPGGVLGTNQQLVDKQGLLASTSSPTDIAISGDGFFVVNQKNDGSGQVSYTRAGSFTQDSTGNFRNAAGFFLQAWRLDPEGRLPGEPGNLNTVSSANLTSLTTVNVKNLTGVAASTSNVSIGANLNSAEGIYPGASGTLFPDTLHVENVGIKAKDIIVPGGVNTLTRGDRFTVATSSGLSYTYRYSGFTYGRDVNNTGASALGDSGESILSSPTTLSSSAAAMANNPVTTGAASSTTVTITSVAHGLTTGDAVTLAGLALTDGIPASELNATHIITVVDADTYTITTTTGATAGSVTGGGAAGTVQTLPFTTTASSAVVKVRQVAHGLADGQVVTLAGNTGIISGIPAADLNGTFIIDYVDADHYNITAATTATAATGGGAGTVAATTRLSTSGNILDASNSTTPFLSTTGISDFSAAALKFSITTGGITTTFSYTSASPNTSATSNQFNNLSNLAEAINNVNGLSARVSGGRLYVGATDANAAVTFANGSDVGTAGTPVQWGLDWVKELGLTDIATGTDRFSTMQGLSDLVNNSSGLTATISGALSAASLKINVDDPLGTITFSDRPDSDPVTLGTTPIETTDGSGSVVVTVPATTGYLVGDVIDMGTLAGGPYNGISAANLSGKFRITAVTSTSVTIVAKNSDVADASSATGPSGISFVPPTNYGSIISEFGIGGVASLNNAAYTPQSTGTIGPVYDPTSATKSMASGNIVAQFSRPIRIYDSLGGGHDLTVSFIKSASNKWAVEVYASTASEVTSAKPNGLIATGNVFFNGDGSLQSVDNTLLSADVSWTNGAVSSTIAFDWGTAGSPFGTPNTTAIGKTDGLSQFNSAYRVNFANQNGAPVGDLTGVSITEEGFVVASYSNGQTQNLFKIPLASFANPDQLASTSGNVFNQSADSGEVNLRQSGESGVGKIASSQLEQSNVELADQLTDMIVAQRAYQANTKVISTTDQLLSQLNDILR